MRPGRRGSSVVTIHRDRAAHSPSVDRLTAAARLPDRSCCASVACARHCRCPVRCSCSARLPAACEEAAPGADSRSGAVASMTPVVAASSVDELALPSCATMDRGPGGINSVAGYPNLSALAAERRAVGTATPTAVERLHATVARAASILTAAVIAVSRSTPTPTTSIPIRRSRVAQPEPSARMVVEQVTSLCPRQLCDETPAPRSDRMAGANGRRSSGRDGLDLIAARLPPAARPAGSHRRLGELRRRPGRRRRQARPTAMKWRPCA